MTFLSSRFSGFIAILLLLFVANPIRASQLAIDFADIQQQALLASAAYLPENNIRNSGLPAGYSLDLYKNLGDIQISFYLTSNEAQKTQTIAIRGTSNIENAMVDLDLKLVLDQATGIYLHRGFSYAAKQILAEVKPLLKENYRINATGHSLGGAVAFILAAMLDKDGFDINQVVTFGQPKVTNLGGAGTLKHLNVIRVVTPQDLVPLVPLLDPLDIDNIDIYWHVGREIILLPDRQYAILQGIDSMLRATGFTQRLLGEENLQHHRMQIYLALLANNIEAAEEVTFKHNFNLFNLFNSK